MPGFMINKFGADVGDGVAHTTETRRKHRWYFESIAGGLLPSPILLLLKEAARPQFTFDEAVMEHNQETAYFAGKQKWAEVKLVWYDAEQPNNVSETMWQWIDSVVTFGGNLPVKIPGTYKKDAFIVMIKGDGSVNERWAMYGCWPKDVNWQSLDYGSSDIQTVEVSMRYDRANRVQ